MCRPPGMRNQAGSIYPMGESQLRPIAWSKHIVDGEAFRHAVARTTGQTIIWERIREVMVPPEMNAIRLTEASLQPLGCAAGIVRVVVPLVEIVTEEHDSVWRFSSNGVLHCVEVCGLMNVPNDHRSHCFFG